MYKAKLVSKYFAGLQPTLNKSQRKGHRKGLGFLASISPWPKKDNCS